MSIILTVVNKYGIVMASESRCVAFRQDADMKLDPKEKIFPTCDIVGDSFPKTFLLAPGLGLSYSGTNITHDWDIYTELKEIQKLALTGEYSVLDLAEMFNQNLLNYHLSNNKLKSYTFHIGKYKNDSPEVYRCAYREQGFPNGEKTEINRLLSGAIMDGNFYFFNKLMKNEEVELENCSVAELIEFAETGIALDCKLYKFLKGYQELAGGNINTLVLTADRYGYVQPCQFNINRWDYWDCCLIQEYYKYE